MRRSIRLAGAAYVISVLGPDCCRNWDWSDMDAYREKRGRWQVADRALYLLIAFPGSAICRGVAS